MTSTPSDRVFRHLLGLCEKDTANDGELLARFLSRQDGDALAALMRRHGRMVWGVCRRLLRGHQDAEDAFQATFLVLVRKAATLATPETVANWLYGVAHRTSVRMRTMAAKRDAREKPVSVVPESAEASAPDDLAAVLDEELSRLPDKYRALVVMCDLEGVTRKDAARRLGIAEGTAASRLATARAMLAKRLARRGIAATGVLSGAVLGGSSASAAVPAAVLTSTINSAVLTAAGQGAASATVVALSEGVLKAMTTTKLTSAAVMLFLALAGGGAMALMPAASDVEPPVAVKADEKLKEAKMTGRAEDDFPGEWVWAGGSRQGSRLAITKTADGYAVQMWAKNKDREVSSGKTSLLLLRDYDGQGGTDAEKTMNKYGFAVFADKSPNGEEFAKSHVTFRVEKDRLIVEEHRVFTDKSGRPNYRSRYEMTKKK